MGGSIWGFQARNDRVPATAERRGVLVTRVNAHFENRADGSLVFYPLAGFGRRGYIVSSDEAQSLLRKRAWWFHLGLLIASFVLVMSASYAYTEDIIRPTWWQMALVLAGLAAGEWLISRIAFRGFTKNMTASHTHNSPWAYWQSMGKTMNPLVLFLSTSFLVLVASAGLFFAIQLRSSLLFFCFLAISPSILIGGIALQSWWQSRSK